MRFFLASVCLLISSVANGVTYVAIGDSITSGFNSDGKIFQHSWATGWGLERPFSETLKADKHFNVALPGATTGMLGYQAAFAAHVQPDYVSILAGVNDVCWLKPGDILRNIEKVVRSLAPYTAVKQIYIGALPDLRQLYNLRRDTPQCGLPKIMCHRYFMGSEEQRRQMDNDILATNRDLAKLQVEYSKVKFVNIADRTYEVTDISESDCFHPSRQGQQRIADAFSGVFHEE